MDRFTLLIFNPSLALSFAHPSFLLVGRFPDLDAPGAVVILGVLNVPNPPIEAPVGKRDRRCLVPNIESDFLEERRAYLCGQVPNVGVINIGREVMFEWTVDYKLF